MVDSGQMPRDPLANPDHLSIYLKEGTITEGYLSEMNDVYMEIFPSYSQIVADCDKMRHRAQIYRKKSSFPERAQWTPPGRELSDEEKEFLQGPSAQVTFLKKLQLRITSQEDLLNTLQWKVRRINFPGLVAIM